ncbi:MAG: imidazole glycerol phosphate synthase subunit HisH [Candidatus Omnitrophota bacterium]|nr:imidazole glycerol phosphate synthase subunit HisH [Candidatus Omnitrophota bacterium]
MIAIIDYGMGNIHSVQKALESMGAKTVVTNKPADIKACDKAVLPGVGAFDDAMQELKEQNLISTLTEYIRNKKIFLGICLGMQLLFESSEEARESKGLGILKGTVNKFENKDNLKVPHMGWNQLKVKNTSCPLLKDIPNNSYVYFCHSYYPKPYDERIIAATTDYGVDFTSILWQDNIYGAQFHPEKSQETGLKILRNFVSL